MSEPYGIISDTHLHLWATFSHIDSDTGLNNRLMQIMSEIRRAAKAVKKSDGHVLVHCGDVFHVRGNLAPSVLNPAIELFDQIVNDFGIEVRILAGNHDLEGKDSTEIGNAAVALRGIGCKVYSEPYFCKDLKHLYVPYYHSMKQLRGMLKEYVEQLGADVNEWTLFLHAPLNEVISGIPDNGLSAKELEHLGFKHVFCGHYHHHRNFNNKVFSVGATTHQTFSDVGSKAGFVIVGDEVTHYGTSAPRFVDFDAEWDEEEQVGYVLDNYVRVKLQDATNEDVDAMRKCLEELGAAQVQIIHVPKTTERREKVSSVEAGASMHVSISKWCDEQGYDPLVAELAQQIADEVDAR